MKWRRVAGIVLFFVLMLSLSGCVLPPLVAKTHTPASVVKDSPTPTVRIPTGYAQSTSEGKEASSKDEPTSTPEAKESTAKPKSTVVPSTGGALKSYRIHAETRKDSIDGELDSQWDVDFIADPLAMHQWMEGGISIEAILIGTTYWTRMNEGEWRKIEFTEKELKDWDPSQMQDLPMEITDETPLDDSIEYLMGQPHINLAKGSLVEAGTETVNDIPCKRYLVDSTYSYKTTFTEIDATAKVTELQQGEIWVADQAGWPAFLVRARLLQTTTTEIEEGQSSTDITWNEQDVTSVNSTDIEIVAPE
ncbi:MAG: hypothetical protein ACYCZF_16525 [Anaerolineae bacterium]